MMQLDNFTLLLDSHGADPQRWPLQERNNALALLATDPSARLLHEAAQALEFALDRYLVTIDESRLSGDIVANLPAQRGFVDRFIDWLWPGGCHEKIWRPALAATLPLVFGVIIGVYAGIPVYSTADQATIWEEEIALLALVPEANDDAEPPR